MIRSPSGTAIHPKYVPLRIARWQVDGSDADGCASCLGSPANHCGTAVAALRTVITRDEKQTDQYTGQKRHHTSKYAIHMPSDVRFSGCRVNYPVTAPVEAEDTSFAYFAITPFV